MVKTTGGPALGASVVSPAMTTGAISLLQEHLTNEEKELWNSLGNNWTLSWSVCCNEFAGLLDGVLMIKKRKNKITLFVSSQLGVAVPPYTPAFLDGWQPRTHDASGRPREDPIESQHKQDRLTQRRASQNLNVVDRGYRTDGV